MTNPEWDALVAEVNVMDDVADGATKVINTLADKVAALATQLADSPTKQQLLDLAAQAKAHVDPLSAAVVANTPAA